MNPKERIAKRIEDLMTSDGCVKHLISSTTRHGDVVSLFEYRVGFNDNEPVVATQILVEVSDYSIDITMENNPKGESVTFRKTYRPFNQESVKDVQERIFKKLILYVDEYLPE